jgi:hypothetical protein
MKNDGIGTSCRPTLAKPWPLQTTIVTIPDQTEIEYATADAATKPINLAGERTPS